MTAGIESLGVDTVPDALRTSRPRDVVTVLLGGNLALSVAVFGWLPVLYGLGWWPTVAAVVIGSAAGASAVAPLALLGLASGTNNSVTSGAWFGVRGRLVASVIGLLLCLGYVALTIWTGGEAVAVGIDRWVGRPGGDGEVALAYVLIAAAIAVLALYGYRWLVLVNRVIVPLVGVVLLLVVVALAPSFDAGYAGTPDAYLLGGFWPTWLLAVLTSGVAGPVSYVTLTGDWTRYVSPQRHRPSRVVAATGLGLFAGLVIPTLWGAFVAVVALDPDSFVAGLVGGVPGWLVAPVVLVGVVGSLGQGGLNLYSMGLDLDAILPRLTRAQATLAVTAVSVVLVFVGTFVVPAQTAVTTFVVVLTSLATPWATVTMIGYARRRTASGVGELDTEALQVFNRGLRGGRYWYSHGWNAAALASWAAGSLVGVLSNSTDVYVGPVADALGGVDVSFLTSALVSGGLYLALSTRRGSMTGPAVPAGTAPATQRGAA